jgi:hypothetical protein
VLIEARNQEKQWNLIAKIKAAVPAASRPIDALLGSAPTPDALPTEWKGGLEAQLGKRSTLLDITFLERGLHVAKAIVHLTVLYENRSTATGTGFLIGRDTLLTNHHVLFDGAGARATWVEARFRYEQGIAGTVAPCRAETIQGDVFYDWAVVQLQKPAPTEIPAVEMKPPTLPVTVGFPAFIIQHPIGGVKKVGLYRNEVRFVSHSVVQYLTDTEGGSSGAPVFNERWEIIALHHSWVEAELGRSPGTASASDTKRNQGIRIDRVIEGLMSRSLLG